MKKYQITAIAIAAVIAAPALAGAWTSAPANPPNNNVDAPLNQGGQTQLKVGNLELNTGNSQTGLIIYGSDSAHGRVGIGDIATPSYKLQVGTSGDGSSVGSNAFFYMSDARLKTNVADLSNSLSRIMSLRGVSFDWKKTGASDVGLIAQEVEKIYPEVVYTGDDGIKSVEYGHLIAPLIEAVKAQQREIEELKAEIAALKSAR